MRANGVAQVLLRAKKKSAFCVSICTLYQQSKRISYLLESKLLQFHASLQMADLFYVAHAVISKVEHPQVISRALNGAQALQRVYAVIREA
jgi:hypothetical protein